MFAVLKWKGNDHSEDDNEFGNPIEKNIGFWKGIKTLSFSVPKRENLTPFQLDNCKG